MSDTQIKNGCLCVCKLLAAIFLIIGIYFLSSTTSTAKNYSHKLFREESMDTVHEAKLDNNCKTDCRAQGSESLPAHIVEKTTNFKMHQGSPSQLIAPHRNLLAIPVGIKQKKIVDMIVSKFLLCDFVVMLFHYDGVVDEWYNLAWSDHVVHVASMNQTKWWFAKRFLHPDTVADYENIFLWDEDIGVDYFSPERYLSIIKEEGFAISQPALDPVKSYRVHHGITARKKNSRVHRRFYKFSGRGKCYDNSTAPPCTGWVELMVPVFSRKAWRCAWYMIQNDLIHAWGLDKKLGYCAQGDRVKNVGVVDSEYVVHLGLPTLGTQQGHKTRSEMASSEIADFRSAVRDQSSVEMKIFEKRWKTAVMEDQCWTDPYPKNPDGIMQLV